jgi:hypothetical protein
VVEALHPRALLIANTFGPESIGHFRRYRVDGRVEDARVVGKLFNRALGALGYRKVETSLWNDRPAYWKRWPLT